MNLKEQIKNYVPYNEQEKNDRKLMLEYIDFFPELLTRSNPCCHFTASAWIVNQERTKVLMVYHNIYHSWSWVGGHCDGDANLIRVVLKEIEEETGLKDVKVLNDGIFGLQILTVDAHIKKGNYISSHLHLDCCFLIEAEESSHLRIKKDENSKVKWILIDKVNEYCTELKMRKIYQKMNDKLFK